MPRGVHSMAMPRVMSVGAGPDQLPRYPWPLPATPCGIQWSTGLLGEARLVRTGLLAGPPLALNPKP